MAKEEDVIRKFVVGQLQKCTNLSKLTLGILRSRYMEKLGTDSLSTNDRQLMKNIVEEELLKMQDNSDDEPLIKFVNPSKNQNKRKRQEEDEEGDKEKINNDGLKRSRQEEASPPDSPDSGIERAMTEGGQREGEMESENEEEKKTSKQPQKKRFEKGTQNKAIEKKKKVEKDGSFDDSDVEVENKRRPQEKTKIEDSSSEDDTSDKVTKLDSAGVSEEEILKGKSKRQSKTKVTKTKKLSEHDVVKEVERQVFGTSSDSEEEKMESNKTKKSATDEENSEDSEEEKAVTDSFSKATEEGKSKESHKEAAEDSDSSSLPSLEDEEEQEKNKKEKISTKKKRGGERDSAAKGKDEEHKTVSRLKRYIALCGVRRNYKKLLDGCRSVKAKVAVLKKELEELGVKGNPSIEKCKKARLKREEAQELAELDPTNIISTQGRPRRRASAWPPPQDASPAPCSYKRVVDSDSESEEDHTNRSRKRAAWGNLQGIISDDGESD